MIKYPETCLISGAWLLVSGHTGTGYTLLGLSMFICFARFAMKINEEKEKQKLYEDNIESLTGIIQNAALSFGLLNGKGSRSKNEISH